VVLANWMSCRQDTVCTSGAVASGRTEGKAESLEAVSQSGLSPSFSKAVLYVAQCFIYFKGQPWT
jgi:hypothetical protein